MSDAYLYPAGGKELREPISPENGKCFTYAELFDLLGIDSYTTVGINNNEVAVWATQDQAGDLPENVTATILLRGKTGQDTKIRGNVVICKEGMVV